MSVEGMSSLSAEVTKGSGFVVSCFECPDSWPLSIPQGSQKIEWDSEGNDGSMSSFGSPACDHRNSDHADLPTSLQTPAWHSPDVGNFPSM